MSVTTSSPRQAHRHVGVPPRRRTGLWWGSGALAATILVLGTSGTLGSWTSAVIDNDDNDVATAQAVILTETDGATTCRSSDAPTTNSYTCTTINKYGGTSVPLSPGDDEVTDVTFTNSGSADAATFTLAPGSCSQAPGAGTGTPAAADLCASGDLTVEVGCSPGATYDAGSAWPDLSYAAAAPPTAPDTHATTAGDLDADAQWTCRFTVALDPAASVLAQDVTVSQPLTWTLSL